MTPTKTVLSLLDLNPRKYGSLEEYMVRISEALRARNCSSVVAFPEAVSPLLHDKFEEAGATIELMASEGRALYRDLRRLLREYRPEIVHFHFYNQFSMLPLYSALHWRRAEILFTDHSRLPINRAATKAKCTAWDRVVLGPLKVRTLAVSGHVKRVLEDNYGMSSDRVNVLFNGVNVSRFSAPDADRRLALFNEFGLSAGTKLVVAAGYFIKEKGFSDLLKAAARIRQTRNDFHVILVGDGPVEPDLKAQVKSLGIEDTVKFAGLRFDVDRFMSASDVVVVPSIWQEPAGLVVVEAMACSRPVIAARVGGIPEYLQEGTCGILVQPGDDAGIADAILQVFNDSGAAEAMGQAGRKRAEQLFSMEKWVADTMKFYDESLTQRDKHKGRVATNEIRRTSDRN